MRWDEFVMNQGAREGRKWEGGGSLHDERRRITSKSAIKMCIKMSKNIYLHKVGHERMRQQLTEQEREREEKDRR